MTTIDAMTAQTIHENKIGYRVGGEEQHWTKVADQDQGDSRWHHNRLLVIQDFSGQHWGLGYGVGLTEEQENEFPWEGYEERLPLTRLYPHSVTTTVYKTEPAEVTA